MTSLCLLLVLTACLGDDGDRQFAGDRSQEPVTLTPTSMAPTATALPVVAAATPVTLDDVLRQRSQRGVVSVLVGEQALTIDAESGDVVPLTDRSEDHARAVAVSPDAARIAVLHSPRAQWVEWTVAIFDERGEPITTVPVTSRAQTANDGADAVATGPGGIAWSPDGKRLAVSLPTGGIYLLTIDSLSVETMVAPVVAPSVGELAWSDDGGAIAFLARPGTSAGFGLSVASTAALPLDPVVLLEPDVTGNRSAAALAWLPDGRHVAVVVTRRETGLPRGEVWLAPAVPGDARLIWTPSVAPGDLGAQDVAVAPDGDAVAIAVEAEPSRLIVQPIDHEGGFALELPARVVDPIVSWTSEGVLIIGRSDEAMGSEQLAVFAVSEPSGAELVAIWPPQGPEATPAAPATPAASPEATPVAIGSPISVAGTPSPVAATPVASPVEG